MSNPNQTQTKQSVLTDVGTFFLEEPDFVPIEIRWWGYARGRIWEYNADDDPKANTVRDTLEREQNKVIIESPDEAATLAGELENYIDDYGRIWITHSRSASIERVHDVILDEMAKRGYERQFHPRFGRTTSFTYTGIRPSPDPEPEPELESTLGPRPGSTAWIRNRREGADMDALLDLCVEHARHVCSEVWPGETVDPDVITWRWNTRLRSSAGRYRNSFYHGARYPGCDRSGCSGYHEGEIELAPGSYYTHGLAELLATVRHELIHAWQDYHPDCGRDTHGPMFRQWVDEMDTSRYCKHWSN